MQVKQETYNLFKELLFKASPEVKEDVMKLEFGTNVLLNNRPKDERVIAIVCDEIFYERGIDYDGRPFETNKGYVDGGRFEFIEIIGKDITLEMVLRALIDNKKPYGIGTNCNDKEHCYFLEPKNDFTEKDLFSDTKIYWQLGKPAHEQSEETILEIINLLK